MSDAPTPGAVILGYGYHGISCGACGCSNVAVSEHPDVEGTPAVFLRCWEGCTALRPRAEYASVLGAAGADR
jgi:hypothetical protein